MRHLRLKFIILVLVVIALSALCALLCISGRWAAGSLVALAIAIAVAGILNLMSRLAGVMHTFVKALEMNDTSLRFDFGKEDRMLSDIGESMDHIMKLYHTNAMEIETGKIFYDRVLKVMTHEMRNAITPVATLSAAILKNPEQFDGPSTVEAIRIIKEQSESIAVFLDSYHSLTHLPEARLEKIDAVAFFSSIRQLCAVECESRSLPLSTCEFMIPVAMTFISDPSLLSRMVINLIRNGLDAVSGTSNPRVMITASLSGDGVGICVSDNGHGVDPELRERLFEPFFSTKPGGSGVGLALSHQIAKSMGGTLRFIDKSAPGATFMANLPQNFQNT